MQKKHRLKLNIFLRLAGLLLLLVLFTACIMPNGLYARYITSSEGRDGARVAKWDVNVTYPDTIPTLELKDDAASGEYTFTVESNSEVAVGYDVVVSWTGTWPVGITLSLDGGAPITPTGTNHTFLDAGNLPPNGGNRTHTLKVTAANFDSAGSIGIVVSVNAEQVD